MLLGMQIVLLIFTQAYFNELFYFSWLCELHCSVVLI
jgi:hypothetical protein